TGRGVLHVCCGEKKRDRGCQYGCCFCSNTFNKITMTDPNIAVKIQLEDNDLKLLLNSIYI
ncbi:hypothetical protein C0J52_07740, partial [Blattella germanica]